MSTTFITRRGNIFDSNAQALVNPVNCRGVMGAGLAKQFANRYPRLLKEYKEDCAAGLVKLGEVKLYWMDDGKIVVNLPTKDHWQEKSDLDMVVKGLADLNAALYDFGIESVAIPPVGAGLGGLEWEVVNEAIINNISKDGLIVYLYSPLA